MSDKLVVKEVMQKMSSRLTKEQIEDLISYCDCNVTRWRGNNMQICCPVHG